MISSGKKTVLSITFFILFCVDFVFGQIDRYVYSIGGGNGQGSSGNGGPATLAQFFTPYCVTRGHDDNLYVADNENQVIRKIDMSTGIVDLFAGTILTSGDIVDVPATSARFLVPRFVLQDRDHQVYIADTFNSKIKKVDTNGIVTRYAGGGAADTGPILNVALNRLLGLFINSNSEMFMCSMNAHFVGKIDMLTETMTIFAGQKDVGATGGNDVQATSTTLFRPWGVFQDSTGEVYISERDGGAIRKVATNGIMTTFAGQPGVFGVGGNGGPATSALLSAKVRGVWGDTAGNILIGDTNSHLIRYVDTNNIINVAVGTGVTTFNGEGLLGENTNIRTPLGLYVTNVSEIYFTEGNSHSIRVASLSPPSVAPSLAPSALPSLSPSRPPSALPTLAPTEAPTFVQRYIWDIAGTGVLGDSGDGGRAIYAQLYIPYDVWMDSNELMYVADNNNHRIRTIDPATRFITTYAGTGDIGFRGDGAAATIARLRYPRAVIGDTSGFIYLADTFNNRIRRIHPDTTVITTIAGGGTDDVSNTLSARDAQLNVPLGFHMDFDNHWLYFSDMKNSVVRKLDLNTDILSVIAGTLGVDGATGFGVQATAATLRFPFGVYKDSNGVIYISERENYILRRIETDGIITLLAGTPETFGYFGDGGPATDAILSRKVRSVRGDSNGVLYFSDTNNHRIRQIDLDGFISTAVGTGDPRYNGEGLLATLVNIRTPMGLFITNDSEINFAEGNGHRIRGAFYSPPTVDPTSAPTPFGYVAPSAVPTIKPTASPTYQPRLVYLLAGNSSGAFQGDGGDALDASIFTPYGVWKCFNGDLLIVDNRNDRIRLVNSLTNIISTFAGNGVRILAGDGGPATDASLNHPRHVLEYQPGTVLISDGFNHRIRRVVGGTIDSYVGGGNDQAGTTRTSVELQLTMTMFVDDFTDTNNHKLFFTESYANVVRRVDMNTGALDIVAGQLNTAGASGEGLQATAATFNFPWGLYIDTTGVMYVTERDNYAVRKIDTDGIVTKFAGTLGVYGFAGDGGPATSALFSFRTRQVAGDTVGNIYVTDTNNHRIRMIRPNGIILTEVGTGNRLFNGNGVIASEANIRTPTGMYIDSLSQIYFAEGHGQRVRGVLYSAPSFAATYPPSSAPTYSPTEAA